MKKPNKFIQEFPKIFRIIPENKLIEKILKSKQLFYLTLGFILTFILVLIMGIGLMSINLYRNTDSFSQIISQRSQMQNQINFWQSIADKYQGYKDAYFQIAILEYKLGDLEKARQTNTKALLLDPNFDDAKKLEVLLNK